MTFRSEVKIQIQYYDSCCKERGRSIREPFKLWNSTTALWIDMPKKVEKPWGWGTREKSMIWKNIIRKRSMIWGNITIKISMIWRNITIKIWMLRINAFWVFKSNFKPSKELLSLTHQIILTTFWKTNSS